MVHFAGERSLQFMCREHPQMRLLSGCPASEDACYTMTPVKVRLADLNHAESRKVNCNVLFDETGHLSQQKLIS